MKFLSKALYSLIFLIFAIWSKYLMKRYGFKRVLKKLDDHRSFFHLKKLQKKETVNSLIHSSNLVSRKFGFKCLTTSISNYFCLVLLGANPKLSIGVKFNSKFEFESHAWISVENYVFFEDAKSLQNYNLIKEVQI